MRLVESPRARSEYEVFAERWAKTELLLLGPACAPASRSVTTTRVRSVPTGSERGRCEGAHGAPCIVVDFGTSTGFDVVSPAGEYVGGVLAPGIEVSMDALFQRAAGW